MSGQRRRQEKALRLARANELLTVIARYGRHFFYREGRVSRLEIDARGRIWFVDKWSGSRVFTHHRRREWRGFTEGGTLRKLVEHLADYVADGYQLPPGDLGPWPDWLCDGDPWGYGGDMEQVRAVAAHLGIAPAPVPPAPEDTP